MPTATSPADAVRTMGIAEDTYGPTVNTARSPQDTEVLGGGLAALLRPAEASVLVLWNTADEAVLAHSIAHNLGVGIRRAHELEGVLSLNEELGVDDRVVLFATRWGERRLTMLHRLVNLGGAQAVAVAAVLHSPALDAVADLPLSALLSSDESAEFV